ncbi:hydrolase, HD family [Treponema socranskii subsp. socranskii VPI DR56BR1116 = ATCC 35536]|uniref:bis(5'-nucleosyl)-tetraphosphatase (symmetrical) n=1 Tax=Treponema socranskii subsp. socranskii VPI DR56BR1116 = ATCC 35536 TaxID=1125725 RepID=U2KPC5_TRESO|nr:bis(5'-nucleosyl)-tetraphosphatase (symmetrical) YqeK [Treponema socranskii]ERF61915.1 hydrolase, HD family [Treponema socranskii subsp. socranskii VPI DR56BR1116 = ATCC 35536]ERK00362.1 hydrolase, HD family [Treponema socranskii subsp. socranskii VPI DR56BR1116 = ATCC 35536]
MDTEDSDCSSALTERVKNYAKAVLTKERYEHSVRVAETASRLCKKYGLDASRGYLAGIAHDMCKGMSDEKIAALAREDGKAITALEAQKPSLLHGRAAALMLRRDFGVTDKDILQAVAVHTFGEAGMCSLSKVVYAADKIEPGRPQATKAYTDFLDRLSLDELVEKVLVDGIAYLKKKGYAVAPESEKLLRSLNRR